MKSKPLHFRKNLLAVSALSSLFWLGVPAHAQQTAPPQQSSPLAQHDDDITRQELGRFDQFLDDHRDIGFELRKDPSLVDNREYIDNHPDLKTFLQDHPRVREAIKSNPDEFMRREERFDRREDARDRDRDNDRDRDADRDRDRDANHDNDADRDRDRDANHDRDADRDHDRDMNAGDRDRDNNRGDRDRDYDRDRDRDVTRGELARFDEFLDKHREISEQLRKDPSLVDNREFLNNHPELETYLKDHPGIREEIKSNPNGFMHAEERYDRHEDARNREELASFDHFLDDHREIAEQIRKDPSLVDNREFVKNHPALEAYLQQHPGVRTELKENPNAFMREENRFDRYEDRRGRDPVHERMANFGEFLGGHANISQQLSKDPTLVKNEEYMTNHPELRDYLKTHPDVQQDLMANPQNFVKSAQQFNTNNTSKGVKAPAPTPDATKPKQ